MYNIQVREAKALFIKTGRLNKKIVNDEIAKSWYKCFITHLDAKGNIKKRGNAVQNKSEINDQIIEYISNIIDPNYDYLICDKNANVVFKNIIHEEFSEISNVDESVIGTNAAAISLRIKKNFKISLEEHYLDLFKEIYSMAFPIIVDDLLMGVCMIMSEVDLSKYDFIKFQEALKKIQLPSEDHKIEAKLSSSSYSLEKLFSYPESYLADFKKRINQLLEYRMPTLIMGTRGCGKTALALYLADRVSKSKVLINTEEIPKCIRYDEVLRGLYQYDTVVIENFELLDPKSIALLTVYTEEKIISKSSAKYSDYRCFNIILTTVYTSLNSLSQLNINQRLLLRVNQSSITMKNLSEFPDDCCKLVKTVVHKNGLDCTNDFIQKLTSNCHNRSFKDIALDAQLSELNNKNVSIYNAQHLSHLEEEKLLSLNEVEAQYIEKVLERVDYNLTLASEIIGIGRSTLYRKLEKYQIETKLPKK